MKLYDERVSKEALIKGPDGEVYADVYYLRVRLFKEEFTEREGMGVASWPVYLLLETYESWVGEPGPLRHQVPRSHSHCYVTGPDPKRIRHAIHTIDSFKASKK